jgi:glycosyltransferase involved in cell wall biosynthesis
MNILYLIKTMDVGGAERFTLDLAIYMKRNGYGVTILSSGGIFVNALTDNGINHVEVKEASQSNLKAIMKIRRDIKLIINNSKIDIIHCQHRIFVPIVKSLNYFPAKIVYTANNYFDDIYQKLLLPDYAIGISETIEKNLQDTLIVKPNKIMRINYGVRVNNENVSTSFGGFVGRFIKEKGILEILDSLLELKNLRYALKFNFIGDGPLKETIKIFIQKNGLENFAKIIEPSIDINKIYENIDILLLPSKMDEGLPISILEAMARKKLVIATSKGGIKDVLEDEVTGIVLNKVSSNDILEILTTICDHPDQIEKIVDNANRIIQKNCNFDQMLNSYNHLYCTLIGIEFKLARYKSR